MDGICPVCKHPHGRGTTASTPRTDDLGVDGRDSWDLPALTTVAPLHLQVAFNRTNLHPRGRRVTRLNKSIQ